MSGMAFSALLAFSKIHKKRKISGEFFSDRKISFYCIFMPIIFKI